MKKLAYTLDVVVLAAGRGYRMKSDLNKIFLNIRRIPILYRTLYRLNGCLSVNRIIVVLQEDEKVAFHEMLDRFGPISKVVKVVEGGKERADSVRNGLRYIDDNPDSDVVMTHDGARPFFSEGLIRRLAERAVESGISIPVLRLNETIRQKSSTGSTEVIDRDSLYITQTPQAFLSRHIYECFLAEGQKSIGLTDEASYFEKLGFETDMVDGEKWNIKITTKEDLAWGECLIDRHPELRIAGYDE